MHLPRFTLSRHLFVVAACGVGFASMKGDHLWFIGLSMMTIIGLLGATIGADSDGVRPGPTPPIF